MMKKEKKHKYVASDWYEFDEEKEKQIYLYVCGKKLKKEQRRIWMKMLSLIRNIF